MRVMLFVVMCLFCSQVTAQESLLPMMDRATVIDRILEDRLNNLLPKLMERENIDMWVLVSREYNEDPVLKTMLPATWLSARRRTILVLYWPGKGQPLQRFAVARYPVAGLFEKAWDKEKQPNQWQALADLIHKKNPKRIGVNQSADFALADGMTATESKTFTSILHTDDRNKIVSAEYLALAWLETRTELEMEYYSKLTDLGHKIIAQAFSADVIKPGITTTEEVKWWMRDKTRELKLLNWFHPSVSIQRAESKDNASNELQGVILPGDLLHVDFGLQYLRLHSDQQQHAYVLREGESDAPEYLKQALRNANNLQDIFISNFTLGRSGNDVLKRSRQQAIAQGLNPTIYTHPIGFHGHAAGTTIGMWDAQQGVPVQGDYPLHANTAYSIELNAATYIEQWGKEVKIMLEEQAYFNGKSVNYLSGRQQQFILID